MPTDNRATAERIARDICPDGAAQWVVRLATDCVLAGMDHRDRTAEREAVEKFVAAYCADDELNLQRFLTHYLAAEFDAGERVIRCALCQQDGADASTGTHTTRDECIEALGKRLAEQRGAER